MKRNRSNDPIIETLESRIAPAGVISYSSDLKTATWNDVDGDKVTLKVSTGALDDSLFTTDQTQAFGLLVTKLDLTALEFSGTNVLLSAVRDPISGGDNTVNIGQLDATGHALGRVAIGGDLGRIDAGDPAFRPRGPLSIGSLSVFSMGMLDGASLPAGVTQTSEIVGKIGPVKVRGSVQGILFNVTGGAAGGIASLTIGGSLIGTDDADSGRFSTSGRIGPILIKDSIIGGAGQHSGSIEAGGPIASITLGGSLLGGRSDTPSTDGTGVVRTDQTLGSATIRGSIHGGTQQDSGLISAAGNVGAVRVLGSIVGGASGTSSGGIFVGGNVVAITVKGEVLGGGALDSGVIHVAGKSGAINLLGGLTGGSGAGGGSISLGTSLTDSTGAVNIARDVTGGVGEGTGAVHVTGNLGALKIGGSIHGGEGTGSGAAALAAGAKRIEIKGDLAGGGGANSGRLDMAGTVSALTLSGSLLGGTADGTGAIISTRRIDKIDIGGSVIGGNLADTATADITGSAWIQAIRVGSLNIGGAMIVGQDFNASHRLVNNATIRIDNYLGSLTVKGGIQGTEETTAFITAGGATGLVLNQTTDLAFNKITIGSSVWNAAILAGYDTTAEVTGAASRPDAQIGEVTINGDWIASDLVAGAAWNENFGDGNDLKATGVDNADIFSKIAKISVRGQILGTGGSTTDHFGFVAQEIVEMKIGPTGSALSLNAGNGNDNDPTSLRYNVAGTVDTRVFEIA